MKIDGRKIVQKILLNLKSRVEKLKKTNIVPCLAIILVGDDPASVTYVNQKKITAEKIGVKTSLFQYTNSIPTKALLDRLNDLNHLSTVHGIIIQQPLPSQINLAKITSSIDPKKDVDGVTPKSKFEMPIALAVLKILEEIFRQAAATPRTMTRQRPRLLRGGGLRNWLISQKIVVIGKGKTGGMPTINMLKKLGIKPLIIDSKTKNPESITKTADIIISTVGKPNIVKPQMLKQGVILIGVGISRGESAKLTGDYDQNEVENIASFYTPTPGGVGPVNVAMLLRNLVYAASQEAILAFQSGT